MSNARPSNVFNLCQFKFANGRMCGLPAHSKYDGLCMTHGSRADLKPPQREDVLTAELASPAGDFITQIDINHVLGKLFEALAANRLSPRRAGPLAYIACQLSQTQRGAKKEAVNWKNDAMIFDRISEIKFPGSTTSTTQPAPATKLPSPKKLAAPTKQGATGTKQRNHDT